MAIVELKLKESRREISSAVKEYADGQKVSKPIRFAMHIVALLNEPFRKDVICIQKSERQLESARESLYQILLKQEDDMHWVAGTYKNKDESPEDVKVHLRSENVFGGKQHFIIDRGTQEERWDYLEKISTQVKVYRQFAKRLHIGDPADANLQVSRAYVRMMEVKLMLLQESLTDLDSLRRMMLRKCATDEDAPLPPRYTYLFIYDYDSNMEDLSEDSKLKLNELISGGYKYGFRLIVATSGDPLDIPGYDHMNSVILENGPDAVGEDRAFLNIDGEVKIVDIF